jgi:hypothetical protein
MFWLMVGDVPAVEAPSTLIVAKVGLAGGAAGVFVVVGGVTAAALGLLGVTAVLGEVKETTLLASNPPPAVDIDIVLDSATLDFKVKLPCPEALVVSVVSDKTFPLPLTPIVEPLIFCPVSEAVPYPLLVQ